MLCCPSVSQMRSSSSLLLWTLAFHRQIALFLQTGGFCEKTEVISLGTNQVQNVPLGHCEF